MKNKVSASRLAIATLVAFGLAESPMVRASDSNTVEQRQQVSAVKNGMETKKLEADHFGSYAAGMLDQILRHGGHAPQDWGRSAACARMVRKNRMHRMGIGHAKI